MDIPILSQSRVRTLGITQPVAAGSTARAIAPEPRPSGNLVEKDQSSGIKQHRRGEELVDISELARLLSRGIGARGGRR